MKNVLRKRWLFVVLIVIIIAISTTGIYLYLVNVTKVDGSTITIPIKKDKLLIQVCSNNILKVHYLPLGEITPSTEVIGKDTWQPTKVVIDVKSDPMTFKTDSMTIKLDKKTYEISVYDNKDTLLVKAHDARTLSKEGLKLSHKNGENFYGVSGYNSSETAKGMLRTDDIQVKAGTQGYCGGPIAWTTSGYGILEDSDDGYFDLSDDSLRFTDGSKKDVEYYVMVGAPKEIISSIADISGKSPMFPKWATGFTNSQWGMDEKELISIVDTYRQKQIPIDNYTMDFDWKAWGEDNYGEFRWNTTKFPDGPTGKLKDMMNDKGIKLTGIMKPRIHVDTVEGKYLETNKLWLDSKPVGVDYFSKKMVGDIDFSKPEARTWFFDNAKKAIDTGIVGWWNDEADEASPNFQFLNMQKALYEGQRKSTDTRVWSINRNFYLGAQKYAYGMWSGDISTGFDSMAGQRDRMLSAINLGEAKWGMDTGGFNGGDPEPENYARWVEFSAFVPIFRVHGNQDQHRQPWIFGSTAEAAAKKAIDLRYSLIPYTYTYDRQAYDTGVGIVRPLLFDYPEDKNTADYVDAWMFGDSLLVAPVVEQGQVEKQIYLPKGNWIDYFKGTKYEGGQIIKYTVDSKSWDDIPLFIKKGAIIPSNTKAIQHVEEKVDALYVDVFPDTETSSFKFYDDDGSTYKYEKGEYFIQNMEAQDKGSSVTFNINKKEGSFTPATKDYICRIHGNTSNEVKVGGKSLNKATSLEELMNKADETWISGKDVYGNVTYIKVKVGEEKAIEITK